MKNLLITLLTITCIFLIYKLISIKDDNSDVSLSHIEKKLISKKQARLLFDEYTSSRYLPTRKKVLNGMIDSRSYHYTIDELKDYIKLVEYKAKKKGYKNLGIRFYLGVYPPNFPKTKMHGMQTMFLVPTGTKQSKNHSSFSIIPKAYAQDQEGEDPNETINSTSEEEETEENYDQHEGESYERHEDAEEDDLPIMNFSQMRPPPKEEDQ